MKNHLNLKSICLTTVILLSVALTATAQTTAFNFQGRLNDGTSPANGSYDLQFKLFDAITGGNQVGPTITKANVTLVNGLFSTPLDFGAAAFSGGDRFIEIALRKTATGSEVPNAFTVLGPRQQILAAPYAVRSLSAALADNATHAQSADSATNATNATNAQTAVNAQQLGGAAASQFVQRSSTGSVKAMARVFVNFSNGGVIIDDCYNSTLSGNAATTPPCGFTINHFTDGGFGFNFGFPFNVLGLSLTTTDVHGRIGGEDDYMNAGIYWRPSPQPNTVDIRTYLSGDKSQTRDSEGFTVILYQYP